MAYTTIDDPSAHFQANAYSGSSNPQTITNGGNSDLQPDLMWNKRRDAVAPSYIFDSTRGVNSSLSSDDSDAEDTATGYFASFNSDGFTTGSDSALAYSGRTFVAWQWKANGGTRTTFAESGNNPGGGYQANTTAGFSIIDYTGTGAEGDVQHGLGVVPDMIITKQRDDDSTQWLTWHKDFVDAFANDGAYAYLNTGDADEVTTVFYEGDAISSSVVAFRGGNVNNNEDAKPYIMYCFNSVQGYSKFGSYKGNGNANGPFVYTGFKPRWIMWKATSRTGDWDIYDTARDTYNLSIKELLANENNAESSADVLSVDILSNGFKLRTSNANGNEDAATYVYAAFAENPFVTSGGVPCTAR